MTGGGGGEAGGSFRDWMLEPTYANTPRTTRSTLADAGAALQLPTLHEAPYEPGPSPREPGLSPGD